MSTIQRSGSASVALCQCVQLSGIIRSGHGQGQMSVELRKDSASASPRHCDAQNTQHSPFAQVLVSGLSHVVMSRVWQVFSEALKITEEYSGTCVGPWTELPSDIPLRS